jgi:hypothetical protein
MSVFVFACIWCANLYVAHFIYIFLRFYAMCVCFFCVLNQLKLAIRNIKSYHNFAARQILHFVLHSL